MSSFKIGEFITMRGGSYSDKWFEGPFRVKRDFDGAAVAQEFVNAFRNEPITEAWREDPFSRFSKPEDDEIPEANALSNFLIRSGYIEHMDVREIDAGDSYFDPENLSAS